MDRESCARTDEQWRTLAGRLLQTGISHRSSKISRVATAFATINTSFLTPFAWATFSFT